MPISRNNRGFLYQPEAQGTPAIGLETVSLQKCIEEVISQGAQGVFGRFPEFQEADLSCLKQLPNLINAAFWDVRLDDLSDIYDLSRLTHFRISGKRPPLELERLPSIQNLNIEHHKKDSGFSMLENLKRMHLWRFKVNSDETYEFRLPKSLESLGIFWSNVRTLEGFGVCPSVKSLEIARCRNLQSLGDLRTTFPKLEHLVVDACGRLTAEEAKQALAEHTSIKHAFAGKKLIVSFKS